MIDYNSLEANKTKSNLNRALSYGQHTQASKTSIYGNSINNLLTSEKVEYQVQDDSKEQTKNENIEEVTPLKKSTKTPSMSKKLKKYTSVKDIGTSKSVNKNVRKRSSTITGPADMFIDKINESVKKRI